MFSSNKPTFSSAMKMFTKAQEELKAAGEVNAAELAEAEAAVAAAKEERDNINRVTSFFDNLLGKGVELSK
ncbi:hypothetical protein PQC34_gp026 [Cronobacter phage A24]|uniref:Uncharacterized protein n=2 Tax=Crifsvirus TaxID=3044695 RepID=A0A7T5QXQ9_9CAUD|nr:hypothetical protein D858_gp024 [Cronobacter phage vB_CsaP_GAP52]YP_010671956.1 hypothetical protein PQC34_gp026 [Cronobacter phage A24]AFC22084.1 hypothetical protein GAP52_090 [Cronobacter phage vB_CsaP_GAP52]QQG33708.1 hypothetical protein [Cronobacter phage A24]